MNLGEVVDFNVDTVNTDFDEEIMYLDTGSVTENNFKEYKWYKDLKQAPSRARRVAQIGDTLFSMVRPNQRHIGFIASQPKNAVYSTGFAVVRPKIDKIDPYYLYLLLSSTKIIDMLQAIGETSASTYPAVKPSDIASIEINLPSLQSQQKISNKLQLIEKKINLNDQINANLVA